MNQLLNKLKSTKMCLIASLPENTYEMAKACWEAGVDAIKVHINFWHRASGNTFLSLEENREVFEKILRDSPVPVGIVPGEDAFTAEANLEEIKKMGFDFISLFGHTTPASLAMRKDLSNFYSINYTYSFEEIDAITSSPFADMLELSICHPDTYGERLNGRDLVRYLRICSHSKIPTIVPTQHVVYPSDIKALHECGVSALMVGAISMGKEVNHIKEVLTQFRKAVDEVNAIK